MASFTEEPVPRKWRGRGRLAYVVVLDDGCELFTVLEPVNAWRWRTVVSDDVRAFQPAAVEPAPAAKPEPVDAAYRADVAALVAHCGGVEAAARAVLRGEGGAHVAWCSVLDLEAVIAEALAA